MTLSVELGLRELSVAVVCIDARQAHRSLKTMKANKTDPHDAGGRPILGPGEAVASLIRARERLVDEIWQLDRELKAISLVSSACQALISIPSVGVPTSAAFAAAVDDASRFKRSRTADAYFGLVPRRHQSGELD